MTTWLPTGCAMASTQGLRVSLSHAQLLALPHPPCLLDSHTINGKP